MFKKVMLMLLLLPACMFSTEIGTKLVRRYWTNTVNKNFHGISGTILRQFQGLYTSRFCEEQGGIINKSQLLQYLENSNVTAFQISNVTTTKYNENLVVTYDVALTTPPTKEPLMKTLDISYHEIFVYAKKEGHWRLLSVSFFPIETVS